jgi:ketosteroid isomerase-like protein
MSRENVEIVRTVLDAVARRDSAAVLALYDPDVEMDFSQSPFADFTGQGHYDGLDAVRGAFRDWYDAWENVETDVDELIEAGEHVVSVFTYRGRGRASGVEVEWKHMAGLWTIREGKIVRVAWLRTPAQAFEAAGLEE